MQRLFASLSRLWLYFRKKANAFGDVFRPQGYVEARLYHAHGPRKGQLHRVIRGENVVTSWLSGSAPTSGRDLMRRLLIPPAFAAETLSGVADAWVGQVQLGAGTTAEVSGDTALEIPLVPSSMKALSAVELDPLNPYVTFIFEYDESEANTTISEAGLYSGPARNDFLARKTFAPFSKNSDFSLQLRWQIRF